MNSRNRTTLEYGFPEEMRFFRLEIARHALKRTYYPVLNNNKLRYRVVSYKLEAEILTNKHFGPGFSKRQPGPKVANAH